MSLAFDYTNSKSIPISIQPSKNYDGKKKKKKKTGGGGENTPKTLDSPLPPPSSLSVSPFLTAPFVIFSIHQRQQ